MPVKVKRSVAEKKVEDSTHETKPEPEIEAVADPESNEALTTEESETPGATNGAADERIFTVVTIVRDEKTEDFTGGKFQNKTPSGAARKAANHACKTLYQEDDECIIVITIRELTKNHPSKEYSYVATRTKGTKQVPFVGKSGRVDITFKYSMQLKSLKKSKVGKDLEEPVADASTV